LHLLGTGQKAWPLVVLKVTIKKKKIENPAKFVIEVVY